MRPWISNVVSMPVRFTLADTASVLVGTSVGTGNRLRSRSGYNHDYRKKDLAITVEDNLIATLVRQLKEGDTGFGGSYEPTAGERRIELPYLQLAMTKLWEAEGGRPRPHCTSRPSLTLASSEECAE
jgi:hypothetical protein